MNINKTYAVFGLGRYGAAVAKELCASGAEVIAVDINEKVVEDLVGVLPICKRADVTDPLVIEQLDIACVDTVVISMASNLEASVMAVMLCKDVGVKEVVVKCGSEIHKRIFKNVGADQVFFPEDESGKRLAKNLLSSGFVDIATLSDEISIVEIKTPKKWVGKSIRELDIRKKHFLNVIATVKDGITKLVTDPNTILDENTRIVIVSNKTDIERLKAMSMS